MDFFYKGYDSHSKGRHVITDDHIEVIRKLRFRMGESGYYSPMPIWSFEDNEDILKEKGLTINEICKSVHFITMLGTSKNMSVIFERLLRQLYLSEETRFTTGYKRPFGNSDVLGDVRDILIEVGFYGNITEEEKKRLTNLEKNGTYYMGKLTDIHYYKEEQKVLESFMKWLTEDFLKNFEIEFREFEFINAERRFSVDSINYWKEKGLNHIHFLLLGWKLDKSEERMRKLNSIGI
jgi:hypothetical protein